METETVMGSQASKLKDMLFQSTLPMCHLASVLFTSTYESLVWAFRRLVSYSILGMESTCPIPTTKSYKKVRNVFGKATQN